MVGFSKREDNRRQPDGDHPDHHGQRNTYLDEIHESILTWPIDHIVLSLIEHTRRGYWPKNSVLERSDAVQWAPRPVSSKAQVIPGLVIYRSTYSMYYANARQLSEEIMTLMNTAQPPLRWFCIDISAVPYVDYSAAQTVKSLFAALQMVRQSREHCTKTRNSL